MVYLKNHGGSCCGAKHIHSFGEDVERTPETITDMVKTVMNGQAIEIILNGTQVAAKPRTLAKLAELGFVLDSHWRNGNHGRPLLSPQPTDAELGSHCYRFTRADRRQALLDGPINGLWNGMVISAGLSGNLLQMNSATAAGATHYVRPLPTVYRNIRDEYGVQGGIRAGDTVRVTNRASRRFDRTFRVLRISGDQRDVRVHMHDEIERIDFSLYAASVIVTEPGPDVRRLPRVGDRVQYLGYSTRWHNGEYATITATGPTSYVVRFDRLPTETIDIPTQYLFLPTENIVPLIAPPPPAAPLEAQRHDNFLPEPVVQAEPVVLFTTFHNVYRDGQVGPGHETVAAARLLRVNGRMDRKEYLSDGTTRMVENIFG